MTRRRQAPPGRRQPWDAPLARSLLALGLGAGLIEIVIFGRGGQGGVTLAKLLASAWFLEGKHVQAFGVYAAERSGAPLNAFVRVGDEPIESRNPVTTPDHVIVLDRSLVDDRIASGLKPGGWILLNSPEPPAAFAARFPGYRIATVDATAIAIENKLGTRAMPIVNSTLLGAAARVLGLAAPRVAGALAEHRFSGPNLTAAERAWGEVRTGGNPEAEPMPASPAPAPPRPTSLLDPAVGGPPRIRTGSWATSRPHRHEWTPPCNHGCPAGNDVRGFLAAVKKAAIDDALEVLHRTSPLPAVCGRVCPAPCTEGCHRRGIDEALNVPELERYVGDHARARPAAVTPRPETVAVVGSGPAGLSACWQLGRLGYGVELFEAGRELGGVLRSGIPPYRLPREALDREVARIVQGRVAARCGERIDRDRLAELSRKHAAVFVATGLQEARALDLGAADCARIRQGIDFLAEANAGRLRCDGETVVVVGGGNTAMDVARSARRAGAKRVLVLYRRTRAEMPAIAAELDEAVAEGVELVELTAPRSVRDGGGVPLALEVQRMELGEPDASGRRAPVPARGPGSTRVVQCDRVVLAVGQGPDLSLLPEGAEIRAGEGRLGLLESPVFVGGDLSGGEGTVASAIGSGRRAAWHIHRLLAGEDLFSPAALPLVPREEIRLGRFERAPARRGGEAPVAERLADPLREVRTGLAPTADHGEAGAEAARCLHCGGCNHCDLCREACPEGVLLRQAWGYEFRYDHCKGCGLCAHECPRGVVFMEQI